MSSIKGIIFDYGGTIDTNGIHWGELIWQEYCAAGVPVEKDIFRDAYVHGERSLAKAPIIEATDTFHILLRKKMSLQFGYLRDNMPESTFSKALEEAVAQRCYNRVINTLAVTRRIIETLTAKFPVVLVTNFYGNMPVVLDEFMLKSYFKAIVESSVVGIRKPDPALFALGIEQLGFKAEEIIVIGDSYRKDIYPSSTLGCRTIWLKNICWADEPIIPGHEPTAIITTLEELPDTIEHL